MNIEVKTRSGKSLASVSLPANATVDDLKLAFKKHQPQYPLERQRFTTEPVGGVALQNGKRLSDYPQIRDTSTVYFKDLGPQIAWRTVFLVEYFGPLFVYLLFYSGQETIYHSTTPHTLLQKVALVLWIGHFLKRELETLFVHRFSNATMPVFNIAKNSGYYWGFAAAVAYFVNHPLHTPPPELTWKVAAVVFVLAELGNLHAHWTLRNLRSPGTKQRGIPKGFLFNFVSCPNYFFELIAWIAFAVLTSTLTAYLFALFGAIQMFIWAKAKHRQYVKEFDGKEGRELYPRSRKMMFPFIL